MQLFYYQAVLRQVVGLVVAIASLNLPVNLLKMPTTVYFAFDSSALSAEAVSALDSQIAWLKKNPKVNVVIQGYCDKRGTAEYNLALGERRANAVKQYLVSQGIAADRISVISYGKERPAVLGNNEAAWAQNRRAVTVVKAAN